MAEFKRTCGEVEHFNQQMKIAALRAEVRRLKRALRKVRIAEPDEQWMHEHNAAIDAALSRTPPPPTKRKTKRSGAKKTTPRVGKVDPFVKGILERDDE